MAEKDDLGKMLHENDVPRRGGVDARGISDDSDALDPKERAEGSGNVGVDADR